MLRHLSAATRTVARNQHSCHSSRGSARYRNLLRLQRNAIQIPRAYWWGYCRPAARPIAPSERSELEYQGRLAVVKVESRRLASLTGLIWHHRGATICSIWIPSNSCPSLSRRRVGPLPGASCRGGDGKTRLGAARPRLTRLRCRFAPPVVPGGPFVASASGTIKLPGGRHVRHHFANLGRQRREPRSGCARSAGAVSLPLSVSHLPDPN